MPETMPEGSWMDRMDQAFAAAPEPSEPTPPAPEPPTEPAPVPTDPATPAAPDPAPPTDAAPPETPASAEAPASDAPPAAPPAAPTPYTFRVDGQDVPPKGAVVQPDGTIAFTREGFETFRSQYVGARQVWRQKEAQYRSEVQRLGQQVTAREAQAEAVLSAITAAAEKGEQAIYDLALGFAQKFPQLKADAEARFYKAQLEQRQQAELPQQAAQQWASWRDEREGALDEAVRWAVQQEEWKALGQESDAVRTQLTELSEAGRLWTQGEDGQWRIDAPTFKWFMKVQADAAKAKDEAKQARAAAALTARNQASLTPRVTAPPMPTPTAPAPSAAPATGTTAKQRWQQFKEADSF